MSRRARLWPLVALVVAIASIAFVLSFDALRTLGMACGVSPALAWMFPLIIDLPVIAFTWATWVFKTRHLGQAYPWAMLVVFSLVSLAGNALHAHPTETNGMLLPQWGASLLMTMPAVALLATSHMIVKSAAKSFDDDEAPEPVLSETDRADLLYGLAHCGLEEDGYGAALDAVVSKGTAWGMEPSACRAILDRAKADMEPPAPPEEPEPAEVEPEPIETEPEPEPVATPEEPEPMEAEPEPPTPSEEPPADDPEPETPATPEPPAQPEPVAPKVINDQWRDRMKASADALDHLYALSGPED